uniref:Uncharacterized protein n=1 Tax=Faxonius propinquus nudivirus TaxID=3139431 RepID=A0AAU8GF75_9VIRU
MNQEDSVVNSNDNEYQTIKTNHNDLLTNQLSLDDPNNNSYGKIWDENDNEFWINRYISNQEVLADEDYFEYLNKIRNTNTLTEILIDPLINNTETEQTKPLIGATYQELYCVDKELLNNVILQEQRLLNDQEPFTSQSLEDDSEDLPKKNNN